MKFLHLIFLAFSIPLFGLSQVSVSIKDGSIHYERVDSVQGLNKDKLYLIAKEWYSSLYERQLPDFDIDDKESGRLLLKSSTRYNLGFGKGDALVRFSIGILVRDGKYKISIADYSAENITGVGYSQNSKSIDMTRLVDRIKVNKLSGREEALVKGINSRANLLISELGFFIRKKAEEQNF